eukprot:TRINITY_DN20659_c0_g1_i2.p1 TRINITY_DN20659_c0_g1~~TRINITY_DN20659_c0_g1_i2.p1  ORF type:complete len:1253 (-),score=232.30 TRINITY_DN20659_c0_g1_i2:197-3955(-)
MALEARITEVHRSNMSGGDDGWGICALDGLGRTMMPKRPMPVVSDGKCEACYELRPIPLVCAVCDPGHGLCAECLGTYFDTAVKDALYAMPMMICALCRGRIGTLAWTPFVSPSTRDQYIGNATSLLQMRCPNCDETTSFFATMPGDGGAGSGISRKGDLFAGRRRAAVLMAALQREVLWCNLLSERSAFRCRGPVERLARSRLIASGDAAALAAYEAAKTAKDDASARAAGDSLVETWESFHSATASADQFVARLHGVWPPGRGVEPPRGLCRAMRRRLPLCVEDPERRLAVQLAWLRRYPKVRTPCCQAKVCFRCKVQSWHRGQSCEERQRKEVGRDAQACPNCQVPTTLSDGCSHIRCICGKEWTWKRRDQNGEEAADDSGEGDDDEESSDSSDSSSGSRSSNSGMKNRSAMELAALWRADANSGADSLAKVARVLALLADAPGRGAQSRSTTSKDQKDSLSPADEDTAANDSQSGSAATSSSEADPTSADNTEDNAIKDTPATPSAKLLPLNLAVRARNTSAVRVLVERGALPDEATLWELSRVPHDDDRRGLEDELLPLIRKMQSSSWPLWATVQFGSADCENSEALQLDFGVTTATVAALRRQRDPLLRARYERELRAHLGDEWFEVLRSEVATSEMVGELRAAIGPTKKEPNVALLEDLLQMGADPRMRSTDADENSSDSDDDSESEDVYGGRNIRAHVDAVSSEDAEDAESHGSVSSYWCPGPKVSSLSPAELLAMWGRPEPAFASSPLFPCLLGLKDPPCANNLVYDASAFEEGAIGDTATVHTLQRCMRQRRGRLLVLAIRNGNLPAVKLILNDWSSDVEQGGGPLPRAAWHALHSQVRDVERRDMEAVLRDFLSSHGLDKAEVPLWVLVQLGKRLPEGNAPGAAMHAEACNELESWLAIDKDVATGSDAPESEDGISLPLSIFTAVRRCEDGAAQKHLRDLLREKLGEEKFKARQSRAATRELLVELRDALHKRRPPDSALAVELMRLGADMREGEDDESAGEEDPWDTKSYKSGKIIELLVLNKHADTSTVSAAVRRAKAVKSSENMESYIADAVRARHPAAARALLENGVQLTRAAIMNLRKISDADIRHEFEDIFTEYLAKLENTSDFLEVGLWALVQCGYARAVTKAIDEGDQAMDAHVLIALRRCRKKDAQEAMEKAIRSDMGKRGFSDLRAVAATAELLFELREAVRQHRVPSEELVVELLGLGADPEAHDAGLEDSDSDSDDTSATEDEDGEDD